MSLPKKEFSKDQQTGTDWDRLLADYQASGLSQKRFCLENNIPHGIFRNKRYRMTLKNEAHQKPDQNSQKAVFVPIIVEQETLLATQETSNPTAFPSHDPIPDVSGGLTSQGEPPSGIQESPLIVEIADVRILIPRAFAPDTLQCLLSVIRRGPLLINAEQSAIFLFPKPMDMRKSIDGLATIVVDNLQAAPADGSLYVFCNRLKDKIKILYWDRNGFCLWYKRLECDRFRLSYTDSGSVTITQQQLRWLLDGLDYQALRGHQPTIYSAFC